MLVLSAAFGALGVGLFAGLFSSARRISVSAPLVVDAEVVEVPTVIRQRTTPAPEAYLPVRASL